jgi:predicted dehydrogenase
MRRRAVSERLRIGIVGGGMISQIAHLPFYLADARCEVAAVAESRPSLVRHLREALGVGRVVEEPGELYADPSISAVVIIAPRPASGPLALAALQAGKDVFVEKPLAHTVSQAQRLVDAAAASRRLLGVAFMKRYDPGVQAAKAELLRLASSRELGALLLARFYDYAREYAHPPPAHKRPEESRKRRFEAWPTAPDWLPAGRAEEYAWFMNAASHDINLLRHFFPTGLALEHAAAPGRSALTATFAHADAPVVFELAKSASGAWLQGAEFVFEKGRLRLELPSPMATGKSSRVLLNENAAGPREREIAVEHAWSFERQAHELVGDLLARRPPLTSGADALDDLHAIEAIWRRICNLETRDAR